MTGSTGRSNKNLVLLLAATALCYLVGYPLALLGHSAVGWVFVGLGGPLLIAVGVVIVRRVHAAEERIRRETGPPDR